ncbi:Phospholipid-transporting ATPase abca7 [Allomyces arbusculus]|nr:Phospholipid-transporting ATPase abca7 [Allomyces arbusculus]
MAHLPSAPTPRSSAGSRPGGPLGAPRDASPTTSMRIQLLPDPGSGNDHTSSRSTIGPAATSAAPALGASAPPPRPSRDNVPPIWATDAASLGPHLPSVHALARRGSNEPLLPPVLPALSPPPPPSTLSHLSPRNSLNPASTNTLNGSTNAPPPPWTVAAADPPPPLIDEPSLLPRNPNVARARSANDPRRASAHSYSRSWAPSSTALRAFRNAAGHHTPPTMPPTQIPAHYGGPPSPHPQLPYVQQQQHLHPSSGPALYAHVEGRGDASRSANAGPRNSHRQVFPDDPRRHRRGQSTSANSPSSWAAMALSPFASLRRAQSSQWAGAPPPPQSRGIDTMPAMPLGSDPSLADPNTDPATLGPVPALHRRTSSAAAAAMAAITSLTRRFPLRSIRRPERSAARQSMFQYRPPSLISHPVAAWLMQLEALLRKHLLVMTRGTPLLLVLALIMPALAILLATAAHGALADTLQKVVFPTTVNLNGTTPTAVALPACADGTFYCKISVSYAPQDAYHAAIMADFARLADLKLGEDVTGFDSEAAMLDSYYRRNRQHQRRPRHYLVHFTTFSNGSVAADTWRQDSPASRADADARLASLQGTWYTIGEGDANALGMYYDPALARDYGVSKGTMLSVKLLLENAILNVRSGKRHVVDLSLATFPRIVPREVPAWGLNATMMPETAAGGDVAAAGMADKLVPPAPTTDGGTVISDQALQMQRSMETLTHYAANIVTTCFVAAGSFPALLLIVSLLSQDKFDGVLNQLRQMNLYESVYWLSVYIVMTGVAAIAAGFALIPARLATYAALNQIAPTYLFSILFLFIMSLCALGTVVAVALSTSPYATSVLTVMLMVVTALFLFVLNLTDLNQLYWASTITPWWLRFNQPSLGTSAEGALYWVFGILPFFQLGRALGGAIDYTWHGVAASTGHGNLAGVPTDAATAAAPSSSSTSGVTYPYALTLAAAQSDPSRIPTSMAIWQAASIGAFFVLCWYLNQLTGKSHHWRQPWYFPLMPTYWGFYGPRKYGADVADVVELDHISQAFKRPRMAQSQTRATQPGHEGSVRSRQRQQRRRGCGPCCGNETVLVLDGVSLRIQRGVVTALLGHNGSGKSTLLDVLMGSAKPTAGTGHVFGAPLGSRQARATMGVCPQSDIVYASLTARQHVRLWARFRGVPNAELGSYVESMLAAVSLLATADQAVGEYSGGMRRRLSILGACVGNPDLVVMDEISNGLDPIHRRHVWEFVSSLKSRGAAVLLTSHSTQEVHALADDVVVLAAPGGRVVLHRNLMELHQEQNMLEVLVTVADPRRVLHAFPNPDAIVEWRVMSATTALLRMTRNAFVAIAPYLETPPILDWELHSSMESILPPQPGTEAAMAVSPLESMNASTTNLADPERAVGPGASRMNGSFLDRQWHIVTLFNQLFGMLRKNLQLQLKQVKHNLMFLVLFVGVVVGLTLLVSLSARNLCHSDMDGGPTGFYQVADPFTGNRSCNVGVLKSYVSKVSTACAPATAALCTVPDYAAIKQTRYQSAVAPRLWVNAPSRMQSIITSQSAVALLGVNRQLDFNAMAQFIDYSGPTSAVAVAMLQRPRDLRFQAAPPDAWATAMADRQRALYADTPQTLDQAARYYPATCRAAIAARGGFPAPLRDLNDADVQMAASVPDFALAIKADETNGDTRKVALDLRYWTTAAYPMMSYLYPVGTNASSGCHELGVQATMNNLNVVESKLPSAPAAVIQQLSRNDAERQLAEQTLSNQEGWPLTRADVRWYTLEGLWLLDGPVRHMVASAMTTLVRDAVGPNERIYGSMVRVPDLQYSARDELLMNALVCVLLWLFFTIFILIPMAEHGKFLAYYRVNGLSLLAYWASHYLYCLVYALPFLVVLGGTLVAIYPHIRAAELALTLFLGTHAIIGMAFLYAAIAVPLMGGSRTMASFLSYLVPLVVALPCVLVVYSDVISLPITVTRAKLAFPGVAIAFALRIVLQDFDHQLLIPAFIWLAAMGLACYLACVALSLLSLVNWNQVRSAICARGPRFQGGSLTRQPKSKKAMRADSKESTFVPPLPQTPPTIMKTSDMPDSPTSPESLASEATIDPKTRYGSTSKAHGHVRSLSGHTGSLPRTAAGGPRPSIAHMRGESLTSILTVDSQIAREAERVARADAPCVVRLQGVTKRYRGQTHAIVEDLSLGIDARECFGLLGHNGCGKTHTVNMITGQVRPTEGTVTTTGRLGLCPQDNYLLDELSVEENLRFYAHLKGYSVFASQRAARHVASLVGLVAFRHQRAGTLSGGMKRRVSLAIALLGDPTTLVCDEPTTALDVHHQHNLWRILAQLRDESHVSLVLVSHDMAEVQYLCHRIAIMARGRVRCIGSAAELKHKYGNGWRVVLQCGRYAAPGVRDWVASLPAVVYAGYFQACMQQAASARAAVASAASADIEAELPSPPIPFSAPQVIETTMMDVTPYFADKVKLEFIFPRAAAPPQSPVPGMGMPRAALMGASPAASLAALVRAVAAEAGDVGVTEWTVDTCSLEDVFLRVTTGSLVP